ncbi:MAG: hypothetical protein RL318_1683 [Fibrobacterota bacterium]|jgi:hypothetical protein
MHLPFLLAATAFTFIGCSTSANCRKVSDLEKKVANSTGTARELNIEELDATTKRCQEDLAKEGRSQSNLRDGEPMERARELKQAEPGR